MNRARRLDHLPASVVHLPSPRKARTRNWPRLLQTLTRSSLFATTITCFVASAYWFSQAAGVH